MVLLLLHSKVTSHARFYHQCDLISNVIIGGDDNSKCCSCLLLKFQGEILGKQLIAQITNTGGPLSQNHFDIAIPGGGVGPATFGCWNEFDSPLGGWGEEFGGVSSLEVGTWV